MLGSFVLNSLSAPFNGESLDFYKNENGQLEGMLYWGVVTPDIAPSRIFPPQGAHSVRRQPPCGYWLLGKELETMLHCFPKIYVIFLVQKIRMQKFIVEKQILSDSCIHSIRKIPELLLCWKVQKINGYGIILRAAVGTEDDYPSIWDK